MKRLLSLSALFLLVPAMPGKAQPPVITYEPFETTRVVKIELRDADVDAQIAEISRLYSVNFLADATHFPLQSTPVSIDSETSLWQLFNTLAIQRNVTRLQPDAKTLLFWSKPDVVALAKRAVAGEDIALRELPENTQLDQQLLNYFQIDLGWDGQSTSYKKDVEVSELPPELRSQVVALYQRRRSQNTSSGVPGFKAWFKPGVWERAKLSLVVDRGNQEHTIYIESNRSNVDNPYAPRTADSTNTTGVANVDYPFKNETVTPLNDAVLGAAEHETQEAGPAVIGALQASDLARDANLQELISFQARRRPLDRVMRDVQVQSGITLKAATGSPAATALISGQVKQMPLSNFMNSISQLYGVSWTNDGDKSYTLQRSSLGAFERALVQLGSRDFIPRQGPYFGPDLGREILPYLKEEEKTPVSALPLDLQVRLREQIEFGVSGWLVESYLKNRTQNVETYKLHFESPRKSKRPLPDEFNLPKVELQLPGEFGSGPGQNTLMLHSTLKDMKQQTSTRQDLIERMF